MLSEQEFSRFFKFREKVFDLIRKVDDGYHKSYEGAVDLRLSYENIYEADSIYDIAYVEIELHCYLLVNGRHITFGGYTFDEAMRKAEAWLKNTIKNEED